MEVGNLAVSIVALYTTCRDGYRFFANMKAAGLDIAFQQRELAIQQSILAAWGFHWQIQRELGSQPQHPDHTAVEGTKLHEYLSGNHYKAEGVFNTLSALADTLSNQDKLTKRYGIQLRRSPAFKDEPELTNNVQLAIPGTTIEDVKPVVTEVRNRLSALKKFRWALIDRDNFKNLIADLRSHSESLYRLCPENAFESMNIYLTMECLAKHDSPTGLQWTSSLAIRQAEIDAKSSVQEGYKLLASTAILKASIYENRGEKLTIADEKHGEMWYLGKGLALFKEQVVYVEMRDYRGPPLKLTQEQKQQVKHRKRARLSQSLSVNGVQRPNLDKADMDLIDDYSSADEDEKRDKPTKLVRPADPKLRALISNFFNTFLGMDMMGSVCGLDVAGMIDHTEGEHKGHCSILYKLPGMHGIQSRERPAENLRLRAPVTLQSLLGNKQQQGIRSTLGSRFEMARKLVRAVCLLHSSGWLHKNIRAQSVMFFPEHVSALQQDRYEVKIEIDVSKPVLMGYIFSRPDDIINQMDTSSPTRGDDHSERIIASITRMWDDPWDEKANLKRRRGTPRSGSIYGRDMLGSGAATEGTKETNISGFTLDYYQHPAKHADPMRPYRHAYDVYSLGILLLEVGLWKKLKNYEGSGSQLSHDPDDDEEDHYERRRWICREYLDRLRWECGDTYADVVLSCLMIDSSDDEMANASERELCARLVADLEGCRA